MPAASRQTRPNWSERWLMSACCRQFSSIRLLQKKTRRKCGAPENIILQAAQRTVGPLRSVNTTGPPALMTLGFCAVMISVPRLSSRAEMPMTAIKSAVASPTTTILTWVVRSAVYIDQFMTSSGALHLFSPGPEKKFNRTNVSTNFLFPRTLHGSVNRREVGKFFLILPSLIAPFAPLWGVWPQRSAYGVARPQLRLAGR